MGSPAAVVVVTAAGTSLDFFYFSVFFGQAVTFDSGPVAFGVGLVAFLGPSVDGMKVSARRRAILCRNGGESRMNRVETHGDPVGVNRDEFGRASWGKGKAVLPGLLGLIHLVDPFCIGRVAKVARRLGGVLVGANP